MIAGISGKNAELYTSDVTGQYFSYYANAIGENDSKIKERLREEYKKDLTIKQGVKIAIKIFEETQKENFNIKRFELIYIKKDNKKIERKEGKEIEEI